MTVGLLKDFAVEIVRQITGKREPETSTVVSEPEYVYGLRGIRELFGVSHVTAQRYKDTFLQPAVSQRGRKITVDANMARRLFDEHNQQNNNK